MTVTSTTAVALQPRSSRMLMLALIPGALLLLAAWPARAVLFRLPLSSDTSVHYYFDHGGRTDWKCGSATYAGHRGSDYSGGPRGRAIYAGAVGTLSYKVDGFGDGWYGNTDGGGFGNHVRVSHSGNFLSIYAHMTAGSVTSKSTGSAIACGEQIGGVGTSGNSTGFHLHFEVRVNGTADDPYSGACGGPISYWVNQNNGTPVTTCEDGSGTDGATFVSENYPDNSVLSPGQTFTKQFVIKNSGTTTWTANGTNGYTLRHTGNTPSSPNLGPPLHTLVTSSVAPNVNHTFNIPLVAPTTPGTYRSDFKMKNSAGTLFGDPMWVIIVVQTPPAPSAPTATAATSTTSSSFNANWNSVSNATGYRLDVSTNSSFASYVAGYQNLDVGTATSQNVSGLAAGTTHYYRVRAYNAGGTSGNSGTITAVTVPASPVAGAPSNVTGSSFTANWGGVGGATGYRLDVSANSSFSSYVAGYQNLDVGSATSRNVTGLNGGMSYHYRVRAYNPGGPSANSASVAVTLPGGTNLSGGMLVAIPLPSGYTSNDARAITPDGEYVVGFHGASTVGGTNGYLYNVIQQSLRNDIMATDGTGSRAASLLGVGYRTLNGVIELVLDGYSSGWHANYMTTNDGATWGTLRRDSTAGTVVRLPVANSMSGTATDQFFSTWTDENGSDWQLYVGRYSNAWPASVQWDRKGIPKGTPAGMHGVSGTGRAVGWRYDPKWSYVLDWNGAGTPGAWFLDGLNGTSEGEAFAINADGTVIFGQSPVSGGRPGRWGYKAVVTTNVPGVLQSIAELPNFADTVGTSGSAAVPHGCTPDGKHAVGMSYRGLEKAVLWDTSDVNPANWTVTDLTEYAASRGILGNFTRLTRGYSVGKNGAGNLVITGVGDYNSGGTFTRAFVLTLAPMPAPSPRITTVVGAGTTSVTVTWTNAVVGTNYVLQYSTNLSATNWTSLSPVTAAGPTASRTDNPPPGSSQRYYRIRVQ